MRSNFMEDHERAKICTKIRIGTRVTQSQQPGDATEARCASGEQHPHPVSADPLEATAI